MANKQIETAPSFYLERLADLMGEEPQLAQFWKGHKELALEAMKIAFEKNQWRPLNHEQLSKVSDQIKGLMKVDFGEHSGWPYQQWTQRMTDYAQAHWVKKITDEKIAKVNKDQFGTPIYFGEPIEIDVGLAGDGICFFLDEVIHPGGGNPVPLPNQDSEFYSRVVSSIRRDLPVNLLNSCTLLAIRAIRQVGYDIKSKNPAMSKEAIEAASTLEKQFWAIEKKRTAKTHGRGRPSTISPFTIEFAERALAQSGKPVTSKAISEMLGVDRGTIRSARSRSRKALARQGQSEIE